MASLDLPCQSSWLTIRLFVEQCMKQQVVKSFYFLACLSLALSATVFALDPSKGVSQYVHSVWQTEDGLPQNYVQAITQTRDGYLWLATQEGLVRFDGIKFTVFDKSNTPQIRENNIQALAVDSKGSLWVGTEGGGLVRLHDGKFSLYTTEDGLAHNIVDSIYEDRAGNLWIGTEGGLNKFVDERFITYTIQNGLADDTVLAVCEDRAGNLWIGTEGGLSKFSDGTFSTFKTGMGDDVVRAICTDRAGNLWLGTRSGLSLLKDGRFINYTSRDGLASDSILSVAEDREGNLWIGTNSGLNRLSGGKFATYPTADGLSNNAVAVIYEDREGNIWIGTYGGGLNRLKDGKFTSYTVESGLSDNMAQAIIEDAEGNVWITTLNGLNRLRDGKLTTYTARDGLAGNKVLSLGRDRTGNLWIGTSEGLSQLSRGRFISYTTRNGMSDNEVLAICEGRNGLWIGTAAGLNLFDGKKFTVYTTREGLSNDAVWALLEDRRGDLWIGTTGGLNRFRDGVFSAYTTGSDIVLSLYEDHAGDLWIGTTGGLSRYCNGQFTNYTTANGLFDDVIFQILEDDSGNLWMSSNKGVFRVSKSELEDFAAGRAKSIASVSYGTADGMSSRECNGGIQPAGWKTADGRLWFPTIKGAVVIDPNKLRINEEPPPVVVEQIIVDGQVVSPSVALRLEPGARRLEFHYTGLSFLSPEKVRFKYRLEGYDNEWIDAGARREAIYNNLAPGDYTFRVKASNNDGVWNEAGASFDFYLKPRFYQTYWFYLACVLTAALIVWTIHQLRIRQMRAKFLAVLAERSRIAREIHDTLAQGFVGIGLQLEAVRANLIEPPDAAKQHLDMAGNLVAHNLAEARRTVWNLRSSSLEDVSLSEALSNVMKQLTEGARIETRIKVSGAERKLSGRIESNLLRIGQEAILNAVKHACAQRIEVHLQFDARSVSLQVRDDGRGFDIEKAPAAGQGHFGLTGMRERAGQTGGRLRVNSSEGVGTEITLTVPTDQRSGDEQR